MSTIKLDHVPILENVSSYPEWRRHISQVLQDEGYWGHVEGNENPLSVFPRSNPPATLTDDSSPATKTAFHTWWQEDSRARGLILRRISGITYDNLKVEVGVTARSIWDSIKAKYARVDVMAQYELKEKLATLKLKDYSTLDTYLGEFRSGRLRLVAMEVSYPVETRWFIRSSEVFRQRELGHTSNSS